MPAASGVGGWRRPQGALGFETVLESTVTTQKLDNIAVTTARKSLKTFWLMQRERKRFDYCAIMLKISYEKWGFWRFCRYLGENNVDFAGNGNFYVKLGRNWG